MPMDSKRERAMRAYRRFVQLDKIITPALHRANAHPEARSNWMQFEKAVGETITRQILQEDY